MADRPILQGLWLPRTDIVGWQLVVIDAAGGPNGVYTNLEPGPINQVDVELDSIGCLTSGTVKLKKPRHAVFPPYQFAMRLSLDTRSQGLVAVALGYVPPYSQDAREEYTLKLEPMDKIDAEGYYNLRAYNTLGDEPAGWKETTSTVVQRILKRFPTGMYGTDAAGRRILSRPEDGQAVNVTPANFYEWKDAGYVTLPYGTASRWDGGPGWAKGEYTGIARPPLTPERVVDAGEVTFANVVLQTGPRLLRREELTVDECPLTVDPTTDNVWSAITAKNGLKKRSVTARQYAHVEVWDLRGWYNGSALAGQDNDLVAQLKATLATAQGVYSFAQQMYGEGSEGANTQQQAMLTAANNLRLAQIDQGDKQSTYEPLTAKLSSGFVLEWPRNCKGEWQPREVADLDPGIITGITMWISTSPWDTEAIGYVTPDPDAPLGGDGAGIDYTDLIHPLQSKHTLKVALATLQDLDKYTRGTPFQQDGLEIPSHYFRGPMGPALAALMDSEWVSDNEDEELTWQQRGYTTLTTAQGDKPLSLALAQPDTVPEGMSYQKGKLTGIPTTGSHEFVVGDTKYVVLARPAPPSRSWDGKWYWYVAYWWRQVEAEANVMAL